MSDRKPPQPGEKWRHFKGGEYQIIAIALSATESNEWVVYSKHGIIPWRIFSTEDNTVFRMHNKLMLCKPVIVKTSETWKESDVNDSTIWARPLSDFMEILSSPNGAEFSNYYRFSLVTPAPSAVPQPTQ